MLLGIFTGGQLWIQRDRDLFIIIIINALKRLFPTL